MTQLRPFIVLAALLAVFGGARIAAAQDPQQQPRPGMKQMPMYDVESEATFKGTVEAVEEAKPEGRMGERMMGRGMSGTHVRLETASGTFDVHLGPTTFLEEKKLKLEKGDEIEVLGYRMKMAEDYVVLAREVKRGDETWTLRDASGRPLWRMGRR